MQYGKCYKCKNNHPSCRYIMAMAIKTLGDLEMLINASQTRKGSSCELKIDYECIAFTPKGDEII